MQKEFLLLLGDKIKSKRTRKNITLEQLANKAGVSKSLISQIENSRTVPSLPVLFDLIHSLDEDLKTFFEDMQGHLDGGNILIIRKGQETPFEKEPVRGFTYKRILTKGINAQTVDMVLLELKKNARRKEMIKTDAFEIKYILQGSIEYQVEKEIFILNEGDALLFDGRNDHRLRNIGSGTALILAIYLF